MFTAQRQIAIFVAYFLVYVVWGSTYYFIGVALQGLPPFLLGALRFTTAGILLLSLCQVDVSRCFFFCVKYWFLISLKLVKSNEE